MFVAWRRIASATPEIMIVNAEPAAAIDSLAVSQGTRRWFRFLRKLVGALGLDSSKGPRRPLIAHPIERLIFHNFAIYEIYRGQPGWQYMSLTDVEVIRKLSFSELDDGQFKCRFELKTAPDLIWQYFFKRLLTQMTVRFENRTMVLCCFPAELKANYEQIRNAIALANAWHVEDREELLAKINAQIEELQAAQETGEKRQFELQQQFDGLDI
jgi:hypothetical protein